MGLESPEIPRESAAEAPEAAPLLPAFLGALAGGGGQRNSVEAALAHALTEATNAGRWDVVVQLAGELQARRTERAGVVTLAKRGGR